MDKAIEAAARALRELWPEDRAIVQVFDFMDGEAETLASIAIKAFLSALKEDPEVIKRVGDEIHHWTVLNMEWGPIGYDQIARAALSALKTEVKP
jgi:hypothetical protein